MLLRDVIIVSEGNSRHRVFRLGGPGEVTRTGASGAPTLQRIPSGRTPIIRVTRSGDPSSKRWVGDAQMVP